MCAIYPNSGVVADTTKVRIFKQITTAKYVNQMRQMLLLIPQRYEFSSKSQRTLIILISFPRCCWYHKGTNFQANHNACVQYTLIQALLLIPQRYEFSSKSQQEKSANPRISCCCWYHKGTNFQANHNIPLLSNKVNLLLLIPQRYEFSSKSQPNENTGIGSLCCCWYHKGTNFQANHNLLCPWAFLIKLLLIPQRYEFSSKSQHKPASNVNGDVVADTTKVRIFKQITTKLKTINTYN